MTMTLTQAIARVRFLLDDTDNNPLVSDADITTALQVAQEEVWQLVISSGVNVFNLQAALTSSDAGVVDLSTIDPLAIVNVASTLGGLGRLQIPPARTFDYSSPVLQAVPLVVTYAPRAAFPATGGDPFVWSTAAISSTTLDQLLCHVAASQCWVRTGEPPLASMEKRRQELTDSVTGMISIPSWSATPIGERTSMTSGMAWIRTAHDQLQLVYGV